MDSLITLDTETRSSIAYITLNRPDKYNAFNSHLRAELLSALHTAIAAENIQIIVLRGAGKHFSAGADLEEMQASITKTEAENEADALQLATLLHLLAHSPKPTIAVAQGKTFGGGIGLLACCDTVIAEENATFCFSEVRLGLIPATIAPYVLRKLGYSQTLHFMQSARTLTAAEAWQFGLAHYVAPAAQLDSILQQHCELLQKNGPIAMSEVKKLLVTLTPLDKDCFKYTAKLLAKLRVSEEAQIRTRSFLQK